MSKVGHWTMKAPVVKWISFLSSEQTLGVRVPPGALKKHAPEKFVKNKNISYTGER